MRATLLLLLAGCRHDTLECGGGMTLTPIDADADGIVRENVTLRGTADHAGGLAIRGVSVGGVAADNTGFNFSSWSAVVPVETLVGLAEDDGTTPEGTGRARLDVAAEDACGDTGELLDAFDLVVDLTPETVIPQGALGVTWGPVATQAAAGADDYLPADGSELALVEVCAPADAAGESATLTSAQGSFVGVGAGNTVGLAAGDCALAGTSAAAVGQAWFVPSTSASTAFVSAAAGGATAAVAIDVAGAPALVPSTATLGASQRVVVEVLSDGVLARCTAYGADPATLAVTLGDDPAASLYDGQDLAGLARGDDLALHVEATGTTSATVSVVCCDSFDQCSAAGTYTLAVQ